MAVTMTTVMRDSKRDAERLAKAVQIAVAAVLLAVLGTAIGNMIALVGTYDPTDRVRTVDGVPCTVVGDVVAHCAWEAGE